MGIDPSLTDSFQWYRIERIPAEPAFAVNSDQVRRNQHVQMFHHRSPAQVRNLIGQIPGRQSSSSEQLQDFSSRGIRKGPPNKIVVWILHVTEW